MKTAAGAETQQKRPPAAGWRARAAHSRSRRAGRPPLPRGHVLWPRGDSRADSTARSLPNDEQVSSIRKFARVCSGISQGLRDNLFFIFLACCPVDRGDMAVSFLAWMERATHFELALCRLSEMGVRVGSHTHTHTEELTGLTLLLRCLSIVRVCRGKQQEEDLFSLLGRVERGGLAVTVLEDKVGLFPGELGAEHTWDQGADKGALWDTWLHAACPGIVTESYLRPLQNTPMEEWFLGAFSAARIVCFSKSGVTEKVFGDPVTGH